MKRITDLDKKLKISKIAISLLISFAICLLATLVTTFVALAIFTSDFSQQWHGENLPRTIGFLFSNLFLFLILFVLMQAFDKPHAKSLKNFVIVVIVISITFISSIFVVDFMNPYAMPIAFCGLMIAILISPKSGVIASIATSMFLMLSTLYQSNLSVYSASSFAMAIVSNTIASILVVYLTSKRYTRLKFLAYALVAGMASIPLVLMSTLASGIYNIQLLTNIIWALCSNFIAVLLFMPMLALFESAFNIADDFRLDEICNLNQPLLKKLASEAPGTFNHSLVVGTIAESCAMAIGENPRLAKAGAYYHDIGKLKAPIYFIENQSDYNPHDELIPEVSVSMITSHTMFGEILGKQYKLPNEIIAIIKEHHGTAPVSYFYQKALNLTEETLAVDNYVYPGPKPSTKISAIIMIADTVEAAFRAYMPPSKEEFVQKIDDLIFEKMKAGQFDDCPITLQDLENVKETIINVLPSVHHSRINYDAFKKKKSILQKKG